MINLERNKLRKIGFENWNKTRMNYFLEMGKSSSNVPNVFKGTARCRKKRSA